MSMEPLIFQTLDRYTAEEHGRKWKRLHDPGLERRRRIAVNPDAVAALSINRKPVTGTDAGKEDWRDVCQLHLVSGKRYFLAASFDAALKRAVQRQSR